MAPRGPMARIHRKHGMKVDRSNSAKRPIPKPYLVGGLTDAFAAPVPSQSGGPAAAGLPRLQVARPLECSRNPAAEQGEAMLYNQLATNVRTSPEGVPLRRLSAISGIADSEL